MSKDNNKPLTIKLRFPEFQDCGEWRYPNGNQLFEPIVNRDHNSDLPILAITQEYGAIPRHMIDYHVSVTQKSIKSYKVVEPGDFIISLRSFQGGIEYSSYKGICSPAYIVLRKKNERINSQFFRYYFKSVRFITELNKNIEGIRDGKMVSYAQFSELQLPFPDPHEQEKISNCLISLDELITVEVGKLEAYKSHKKGLMQKLFPSEGKNLPEWRCPEFRGKEEWKIETLSNLFTIGNGKDYKHLSDGDIPVYGSGGYMLSVNDYLYDGESVCIGRKGTIDKPTFLTGKFWTVDTLFYTHSFTNCLPRFIYLVFQNINWLKHNEAGGIPSLSKKNIGRIIVAIPSKSEQQAIINCFRSLDELIAAQIQKIDNLITLKKGLMQGLFLSIEEELI
jgi:type I restriction enzyme S subunit